MGLEMRSEPPRRAADAAAQQEQRRLNGARRHQHSLAGAQVQRLECAPAHRVEKCRDQAARPALLAHDPLGAAMGIDAGAVAHRARQKI